MAHLVRRLPWSTAALLLVGLPAAAQTLSPGAPANTFQIATFVGGLVQLTDFRFLPDGRVVMTQKTGEVMVRRTDGSVVQAGSFAVDSSSEKGLLGVEVHPQFSSNGRLFFYASDGPSTANKHRVHSIVLRADSTLDTSTDVILLQNLMGPANHDGGALAIGPDGKLYVGVGDTGCNSGLPPPPPLSNIGNYIGTCLATANGKILRINLDGTIPVDNPLAAPGLKVPQCDGTCSDAPDPSNVTSTPRTEIWAWGFRNPFRFTFDPVTNFLWAGDVGEVSYEEIDLVTKGQHYGWPYREGGVGLDPSTCDNLGPGGVGAPCVDPKYFCKHDSAAGNFDASCQSITGGTFIDTPSWPAGFRGLYFFGDNANGNVWTLTPNAARNGFVANPRADFGTGFGTVIRFLVGPDGQLYVGDLGGTILRISPKPGIDAGTPDSGVPDAGPRDSGVPDAGPRPDAGPPLDAGPIDFGGGTPPGGLASGTPFQGPETCKACHDSAAVDAGTLYMPYDTWVSTMMGNAFRDPLYRAALAVANQDILNVGQWCLRCHSPTSYVQGHGLPPDGSAFDAIDKAGVSCEACHRTRTDVGLSGNAQLTFEQSLTVHGPYLSQSPAHLAVQDPAVSASSLCGQCHQVSNPVVKRAGTTRPFPLDTTYAEWLASAYASGPGARTCQSCHMEVEPGAHPVAQNGPARDQPRRHTFAGANVWGLDAVRAGAPELAGLDAQFTATRAAAIRSLQSAADVALVVPAGTLPAGSEVPITVRVTNRTGHKLPTGYADGRRVFLQLVVAGQVVSGAYDADAGSLAADPQLAVFEAIHERGDGGLNHLALHDTIFKDSRIPPLGFQPGPDTDAVGSPFITGSDGGVLGVAEWTYRVRLPAPSGADAGVLISARLFHQATTAEYVDALAAANVTDSTGSQLRTIWEQTGRAAPVEMARAEEVVAVSPLTEVSGGCGCHSTSGSAAVMPALIAVAAWVSRRRRRSQSP